MAIELPACIKGKVCCAVFGSQLPMPVSIDSSLVLESFKMQQQVGIS